MLKYCLLLLLVSSIFALKLQDNLHKKLTKSGSAQVFITFKDHVDFKQLEKALHVKLSDLDWSSRGKLVVDSLQAVAKKSQAKVIKFLKENKIEHNSLWISNTITINKATLSLLTSLKTQFAEIQDFELVTEASIIDPIQPNKRPVEKKQTIEAGVAWVKAPEVWKQGYTGKSITIGVIDTGAYLHPDLKDFYREEHGWLDATSLRRTEPYDDNGHGTHCHGTVTGNSTRETVGVAPGATWISCKFLTRAGSGNYNDCVKCMEFMLAPTNSKGQNANSDLRAHVVSNSYGGGVPTAALERALDALMAAGTEMVYAAGNSGSRCSSVLAPAIYPQAISVGALNRNSDQLAFFSSRGPGRNNGLKPEISAPGALVRSCANSGSGYRSLSGTSMACPHVAGVYALLWDAVPALKGKIKETREILYKTAKGQESTQCSSNGSPNNLYGYGTVNAEEAVQTAKRMGY